MKITQVVPYFFPAWRYGGPTKLVYDTSRKFAALGHQVTVLTTDVYSATERMPEAVRLTKTPHLKVVYFSVLSNYLAVRFKLFFAIGFFIHGRKHVQATELLHFHDFYSFQNGWLAWLAKRSQKPYIISPHGSLESQAVASKNLVKNICQWLFGNYFLTHAAALIATSDDELKSFRQLGVPAKKIVRLGHGVDVSELKVKESKIEARHQLSLPTDKIIITYLGRIHRYKGLELLVKAFAQLANPKLFLVIAGADDGYLPELKKILTTEKVTQVRLLGTFAGKEKALLYRASDLFASPSLLEGFSMSILEAAGAGLPLLISTECHFAEIEKNRAGKVVKPTVDGVVTGINELTNDLTELKKMGERAQTFIQKNYSLDTNVAQLLELYQKILGDHP